jgi:hypothetical protein
MRHGARECGARVTPGVALSPRICTNLVPCCEKAECRDSTRRMTDFTLSNKEFTRRLSLGDRLALIRADRSFYILLRTFGVGAIRIRKNIKKKNTKNLQQEIKTNQEKG